MNRRTILPASAMNLTGYLLVLFAFRLSKVGDVVAARELSILFVSTLLGARRLGEGAMAARLAGAVVILAASRAWPSPADLACVPDPTPSRHRTAVPSGRSGWHARPPDDRAWWCFAAVATASADAAAAGSGARSARKLAVGREVRRGGARRAAVHPRARRPWHGACLPPG